MNKKDLIAVTSRSFSKNQTLRNELLKNYTNVRFNDDGLKLNGLSLIKFLRGCKKAITALEVIDENILSNTKQLKLISKYGVGIDMIDQKALKKFGIKLNYSKGVNKRCVSELTISSMISLLHKVTISSNLVLNNNWKQLVGRELTEKVVGIIGAGNVGKDLIKLLKPFRCKILINDIIKQKNSIHGTNCNQVTLNNLIKNSDIITLHVPLDNSTKNLISRDQFLLMKKNAIIINNARGGIINERHLLKFLEKDHLGGVGLDVFSEEPPKKLVCQKLIHHPRVVVTSHIGGSSEEAILKMGRAAIKGLD